MSKHHDWCLALMGLLDTDQYIGRLITFPYSLARLHKAGKNSPVYYREPSIRWQIHFYTQVRTSCVCFSKGLKKDKVSWIANPPINVCSRPTWNTHQTLIQLKAHFKARTKSKKQNKKMALNKNQTLRLFLSRYIILKKRTHLKHATLQSLGG